MQDKSINNTEIVCHACYGSFLISDCKIVRKNLSNGGFHLLAYCPRCNVYIKAIPHAKQETLYFGKYKNMRIKDVAERDANYLRWLVKQNIKKSLKQAIELQLQSMEAQHEQCKLSSST